MTFTNLVYAEFDTTQQNLLNDLRTQILNSASWAKISPTAALLQTNAAVTAGAGSITSGTNPQTAGIVVGSVIRIGENGAADCEYRTVTGVNSTTISFSGLTYAHPSGANVYVGNEILKCTTTRGADMIFDLNYAPFLVTNGWYLSMMVYRAHSGAFNSAGTDQQQRWLNWRQNGASAASDAIHCVVSASKEHIYISLEGPRATELHPDNTLQGSSRQYFFMSDLVPYFAGDATPAVVAGGPLSASQSTNGSISFTCHVSRNMDNTASWHPGKLASLAFPSVNLGMGVHLQRQAKGDGSWYLAPYVFFDDIDGIRGRLAAFWFAGFANTDVTDGYTTPPPVGSKVTYNGQSYKLLQVNRASATPNYAQWGAFGASGNQNLDARCIVVAVPCT